MVQISQDQLEIVLHKLGALAARHAEIQQQLNDPAVASDPNRLVPLSKELARLGEVVAPFNEYRQLAAELAEARTLADDPATDAEMRELARSEIDGLQTRTGGIMDRIVDALLSSEGPSADSVILEIRAGTGGDEAALFAGDLLNMYERYCERHGLRTEVLSASPGNMGGFKEAVLGVKGRDAYRRLQFEAGGHRVQRVPETESQGRIHTSAATVAVLPEPQDVDIDIKPEDVREDVSRAGGPGGQNVNKVASAIRLTHLETGITVNMRDEKSQHKNRAKAWRILRSRVYEHFASIERAQRDAARKSMVGSGDRSQRIRTYNFPQNRLTDHRIGLDLYRLDGIISTGDLDEMVDALLVRERETQLANL
ncbi:MAG: Peptide chain release factor 1 [Phycisphaerae bacterium]|nr:Peptide chain release factor 1 [Phycisphaerae bacterium]